MKKNTFTVFLPFLFVILCLYTVSVMNLAIVFKLILSLAFVCFYLETIRLNVKLEKSARLFENRTEEFIDVLKHGLKIPSLAQIRAIELLLNGHVGKFTVKQINFFNMILESEKHLYTVLNFNILKYLKASDNNAYIK